MVQNEDAGYKVKYITTIGSADPLDADTANGTSEDIYLRLQQVGFWLGCVMGLAIIFNLCAWLFVQCCQGEVPGILHVPRMELTLLMLSMSALAFVGARLFSGGDGLVPLVVGIAVVVIGPVLFLLASYIGIAAALYRKKKAVYLLSSRATPDDPAEHSKWDLQVVGSWMGMSLNRGKWRPADPSRKNEFVFRWGPLFEDCRGPLYQRRKVPVNGNGSGSMSLRRVHASSASDHSSQSGTAGAYGAQDAPRPRRKVVALEEKPMVSCGKHKIRRSGFQAYGVVVSLVRMVAYGLVIGGLGQWPPAQAGVALFLAVAYLAYLRFSVPYSRRDEMALEYWNAVLDVALFTLVLVLALAVGDESYSTIDNMGIGLIVVQCLGFASYLINRLLVIVHAFMEVVCSACTCLAPPPKKGGSRRRRSVSRSASRSESMSDVGSMMQHSSSEYSPDGKGGLVGSPYLAESASGGEHSSGSYTQLDNNINGMNGNGIAMSPYMTPPNQAQMYGGGPPGGNGLGVAVAGGAAAAGMAVDGRQNSRSARQGMFPFPAIAEETDSQVTTPTLSSGVNGAAAPAGGPISPACLIELILKNHHHVLLDLLLTRICPHHLQMVLLHVRLCLVLEMQAGMPRAVWSRGEAERDRMQSLINSGNRFKINGNFILACIPLF